MAKPWVNFHAHSTSSLLDGASRFDMYADRAKELGNPAICFTEHGNIHGLLDAYDAAQAAGLKYFPGMEAYQARKTRFDRDEDERAGRARSEWDQRGPYHLGIIAYNNVGYQNLLKISSRAYTEGYFVKPRIDHQLLSEHSEGLVVLSGCLSGEVQQALLRGDFQFALESAATMQDIVGRGNYFIEMHNHDIEEEHKVWEGLKEIAQTIDAPMIVTCDSHYTHKHDYDSHDNLLCINTGSRKDDENRFRFSGNEFYLKSYDEMEALFSEPAYVDNTMLIYEKHDFKLDFNENHYPEYKIKVGQTTEEVFMEEVRKGAEKRYGEHWRERTDVMERLKYEMSVIAEMGFINYFLVVADIVQYAKSEGILMGPARGSAAGSLVSFCLFITEVDPLEYDLIFERFLVPGRNSPPDIDLDCDSRYRDKLIEYTRQKYGHDHTAQIGTMQTIKAKKAVRDIARVLNYPYELGDEISKAMPPALFGVTATLDECLQSDEFRRVYDNNPDARIIVDEAKKIEGLWRDAGMHAAGLVIADKPITEYVPVLQKGEEKPIVTQWEMGRIDQLGLLKIDFLGLRNLDIISMCLENLKETKDIEYDNIYDILKDAENETAVFDILSQGHNLGTFQMESDGIREVTVGLKPENVEEIAAILALYRPGPMGSNVHHEYIERKHGRKKVTVLHESLKPILEKTYGLLLYQEQLLKIATDVAGFSIMEADDLRKIVGKKKMDQMPKQRAKFVEGCMNTVGMNEAIASKLFAEIEHHASYSFGQGHATGYMFLSYVTAYLHAKYPAEFMAAALSTVEDNEDRLRDYLNECQRLNISVQLPSVRDSDYKFRVIDDNTIVYGMGAIKGISYSSIEPIVASRDEGDFSNFFSFLRTADQSVLNKKVMEHLLAAGAFDNLLEEVSFFEQFENLRKPEAVKVLLDEFEELNVFISDHPFSGLLEISNTKHEFIPIKNALRMDEGQVAITAGVIVKVEKKMTRKGKRMYKLVIQDLNDSIQISIVPKIAETLSEKPFNKGDFIVVRGAIDTFGDEENSIASIRMYNYELTKVDELANLDAIFLKAKHTVTNKVIRNLSDIINVNKGDLACYLDFYNEINKANVRIKFKQSCNSRCEAMLNKILEV